MAKKTAANSDKEIARERSAKEALLEESFNDYWKHRGKVYRINFVRGLFFGLGAFLGGTIVVTLVIYAMSFFVNFPVIGELIEDTQKLLEQSVNQPAPQPQPQPQNNSEF